jgi:hypothetical protein
MAAVDYDVGRRNLGQLYTNLMDALKNKGDAENRRKAEDIERQGLFGTGIKSGDLKLEWVLLNSGRVGRNGRWLVLRTHLRGE